MAITFEDVFDVESEEEGGAVKTLRRRGRVVGIDVENPVGYAEQVWASPAIPRGSITVRGKRLSLKRRRMWVDNNAPKGGAMVELFYERSAEGGGGELLRRSGRVSARQVRTSVDRQGEPVTVTYNGDEQIAPINVMLPTAEPSIETLERTNLPDTLAQEFVGKVNLRMHPEKHTRNTIFFIAIGCC